MPEIKSVASMHIIRRKHCFHSFSFTIKQPTESAAAADPRPQSGYTIQRPICGDGVQGSHDMITEVFGKGMISTPSGVRRTIPREQPGFAGNLIYRASHLARFDNLTALHSRMAMREELENSACAAEAIGQSATLILLDLDDFGDVNDTYGQAAGDACLRRAASRLIAKVGAFRFLARMGEDEFALLLQAHTRRSLSPILKGIQEALALPFSFDGHTLHLTSSIGIAVRCDGRRFNPDDLIRDAALALDEAKTSGKSCHRVFRR